MQHHGVWTAPFYGVQHLIGLRDGFRVTVIDRGFYSECNASAPNGRTVKSSYVSPADARKAGAAMMVSLNGYAAGVPA